MTHVPRHLRHLLAPLALAALAAGCAQKPCVPGAAAVCACPDGSAGAQTCNAEGSGWGECRCVPCVPGASEACTCAGGAVGAQVCAEDGRSWKECSCPEPDTSVCRPQATQICTCAGGVLGAQTCGSDGAGWGECRCPAADVRICRAQETQVCACAGGVVGSQTCSEDGSAWSACQCVPCVPGWSAACACPGGATGSQVCAQDGQSWSGCRCPQPDASVCRPQQSQFCGCPDGSLRVQTCAEGGLAWNRCPCGGGDAENDADNATDIACVRDLALLAGEPQACLDDEHCPCGSGCTLGRCVHECLNDAACGAGRRCSVFGRCVDAAGGSVRLPGAQPQGVLTVIPSSVRVLDRMVPRAFTVRARVGALGPVRVAAGEGVSVRCGPSGAFAPECTIAQLAPTDAGTDVWLEVDPAWRRDGVTDAAADLTSVRLYGGTQLEQVGIEADRPRPAKKSASLETLAGDYTGTAVSSGSDFRGGAKGYLRGLSVPVTATIWREASGSYLVRFKDELTLFAPRTQWLGRLTIGAPGPNGGHQATLAFPAQLYLGPGAPPQWDTVQILQEPRASGSVSTTDGGLTLSISMASPGWVTDTFTRFSTGWSVTLTKTSELEAGATAPAFTATGDTMRYDAATRFDVWRVWPNRVKTSAINLARRYQTQSTWVDSVVRDWHHKGLQTLRMDRWEHPGAFMEGGDGRTDGRPYALCRAATGPYADLRTSVAASTGRTILLTQTCTYWATCQANPAAAGCSLLPAAPAHWWKCRGNLTYLATPIATTTVTVSTNAGPAEPITVAVDICDELDEYYGHSGYFEEGTDAQGAPETYYRFHVETQPTPVQRAGRVLCWDRTRNPLRELESADLATAAISTGADGQLLCEDGLPTLASPFHTSALAAEQKRRVCLDDLETLNTTPPDPTNLPDFADKFTAALRTGGCVDGARLQAALYLLLERPVEGTDLAEPGPAQQALLAHLLRQWLQIHQFVAAETAQTLPLEAVLRASNAAASSTPVATRYASLRVARDASVRGWDLVLQPSIGTALSAAAPEVLREPDYRRFLVSDPASLAALSADSPHAVPLPVAMLDTVNAQLALVLAEYDLAARAGGTTDVGAAALRKLSLAARIAAALYGRAATGASPAWIARWNLSKATFVLAMEEILKRAPALLAGINPDADVPLYFFGAPASADERFSAVSDFLLGPGPGSQAWAPVAVHQAQASAARVAESALAREERVHAGQLSEAERDRRLDELRRHYGEPATEACGTGDTFAVVDDYARWHEFKACTENTDTCDVHGPVADELVVAGKTEAQIRAMSPESRLALYAARVLDPSSCFVRTDLPVCTIAAHEAADFVGEEDVQYALCVAGKLEEAYGGAAYGGYWRIDEPWDEQVHEFVGCFSCKSVLVRGDRSYYDCQSKGLTDAACAAYDEEHCGLGPRLGIVGAYTWPYQCAGRSNNYWEHHPTTYHYNRPLLHELLSHPHSCPLGAVGCTPRQPFTWRVATVDRVPRIEVTGTLWGGTRTETLPLRQFFQEPTLPPGTVLDPAKLAEARAACAQDWPTAHADPLSDEHRTEEVGGLPECNRGSLGELVLTIGAAQKDVEIARAQMQQLSDSYSLAMKSCTTKAKLQASIDKLNRTYNDNLWSLENSKKEAIKVAAAMGAVKECTQTAAGVGADFVGVGIGMTIASCAAGTVEAIFASRTDLLTIDIERAQRAHEQALAQLQGEADVVACLNDAEQHLVGDRAAALTIQRAIADVWLANSQFENLKSSVYGLLEEGRVAMERERRSYTVPLVEDPLFDRKVDKARRDLALARRVMALAVRAVEYEYQQSLLLRQEVEAAEHPDQLEEVLYRLWTAAGTRTVLGSRPEGLHTVLSLRDQLLRLSDWVPTASGGRTLSADDRFRLLLASPRFAHYDDDGAYAGQLVPFGIQPMPDDQVAASGIPIFGRYDCAERIWGVNASIQARHNGAGEALRVFHGTETTFTRLDLLKRNSFYSQWCSDTNVETDYQTASVRPSRNLFRDPLYGNDVGEAVAETSAWSRARIQPYVNVTRAEFEQEAYGQGASTELAARGLYGQYALFIPAEMLARDTDADGVPDTDGLRLDRVADILLRIDYVSVAKPPTY